MPKSDVHYQDRGGRFDDRQVLRNVVGFSIPQRVHAVNRLLSLLESEGLLESERGFLAVEVLQQFVLGTEDTLGWFFVLLEWEPDGGVERTIFALLDLIQTGVGRWSEDQALVRLDAMSSDTFRAQVAHLPEDEVLVAAGWSPDLVKLVPIASEAQLKGFRRVAERRARGDRALVRAYNKSKHMLLAFPTVRDGAVQIDLLTAEARARGYAAAAEEGLVVTGAQLSTTKEDIQRRAEETITMYAALWGVLVSILRFRFGDDVPTPGWIRAAADLATWADD